VSRASTPSPADIVALEAQASLLLEAFASFGAERVDPAIVQPASAFLERMGEELRSQTCVFTGPDGTELCLRPDLTIPAAQLYLSRVPDCSKSLKLCYAGPVFRLDPQAPGQPVQSFQAGVECFRSPDTPAQDVAILMLAHKSLESAGLHASSLTLGDVNLLAALLEGLKLPASWSARIRRHAWNPRRLRELLVRMGEPVKPDRFAAILADQSPTRAREVLRDAMDISGIRLIGTRSLDEIADRVIERATDAAAPRLTPSAAATIESFLALRTSARTCVDALNNLATASEISLEPALQAFRQRLEHLSAAGVDLARVDYASRFGRNMEYYSGLVFEMRAARDAPPLAGGGRYDGLLSALGAGQPTPAIGLAIFCDRLLAAIAAQGGRA
jgi:ATP phosphoribosyltransferase regulatory subunit